MAGIYIHIPFCRTHCTYCGFYSELLRTSRGSESFVDALCKELAATSPLEWRQHSGRRRPATPLAAGGLPEEVNFARQNSGARREAVGGVTSEPTMLRNGGVAGNTLYFGGGTPSLLSLEQLSRILETIVEADFEEFTVEVNPDDIVNNGVGYAEGLRRLGVDRISMGVQSFDDAVLKRMGRRHNAFEALKAYEILREAGFNNISLDFIFGFVPAMDISELEKGLKSFPGGIPEHISCYQLSIEEGSGLEKMIGRGLYSMPDDAECERQYYSICSLLADLGYEHYEISNWALDGHRSRHNSSYWNHTPYIGFGPGAHSLFINEGVYVRRWNNPDLAAYLDAAGKGDFSSARGSETLTSEQIREEKIMLGLRTSDGIPSGMLKNCALLVPSATDGYIRIPEDKWFVSDSIITDLI